MRRRQLVRVTTVFVVVVVVAVLATRPFVVDVDQVAQPGGIRVEARCESALRPSQFSYVISTANGLESLPDYPRSGAKPCTEPARNRLALLGALGALSVGIAALVTRKRTASSMAPANGV